MLRTVLLTTATLWALVAFLAPVSTAILRQGPLNAAQLGSQRRGRLLLAATDCKKVHSACTRCVLVKGQADSTSLLCTACDPVTGWRLAKGGSAPTCECAAGRYLDGTACSVCPRGKYCPGRGTGLQDCPQGLTTRMSGARSTEQCMTTAGWGRITVKRSTGQLIIRSELCPIGTYNGGGNTGPCKSCPNGLTTEQPGCEAQTDCGAPEGFYVNNGAVAKCPIGTYSDSFNTAPSCTPCGSGLTTPAEASTSAADCQLAKRGNYLKAVPIGATDSALPDAPLDVGAQNSTSLGSETGGGASTNITYVMVAVPCPVNTYQDADTAADSCTPCPKGLQTEDEGATGVALCLAPPGMELLPGAPEVTDCPRGSYKEGWNLNPCSSCGVGFDTSQEGSVSSDSCMVPAGYGVILEEGTGVLKAAMCVSNTYGLSKPSFDVLGTKCIPCPVHTATADTLSGIAATAGYTSISQCQPLSGMGFLPDGTVQPCNIGSWSSGLQQRECKSCPAMLTTLAEGATSAADCVVQPGWAVDASRKLPHPCNKGTYGLGGTLDVPGGVCTACPAGFTTQESASVSAADCEVCMAGRGGPDCKECPHGTYAYGGSAEACRACEAGYTSAHGATSPSECVPIWPLDTAFYTHIPLSDESLWLDRPAGGSSEAACKAECASEKQCIMYRHKYGGIGISSRLRPQVEGLKTQQVAEPTVKTFEVQPVSAAETAAAAEGASTSSSSSGTKCQILLGLVPGSESFSARAAVGFKAYAAGAPADYAFAYVPASLIVGELMSDAGSGLSLRDCMAACDKKEECLLVKVTGSGSSATLDSCALYSGALDADWMCSYRVSPERLLSDGFVVSTVDN